MFDLCSPMGYNNNINPLVNWYNNQFSGFFTGPVYNFNGGKSAKNDYKFSWIAPSYGGFNWNYSGTTYNFSGSGGSSVSSRSSTISEPKATPTASNTEKAAKSKASELNKQDNKKITRKEFNNALVSNFEKYLNCKEGDDTYKKFSSSPEWCSDFISYGVKETYKEKDLPIPEGFGSHRVEEVKQWSIKNNNFLSTVGKENKAEYIAKNVKPGNLMILRENGASHIGIVTKVNKNGSFETIEGNVPYNGVDSVVRQEYDANYADLSGFVRLPV